MARDTPSPDDLKDFLSLHTEGLMMWPPGLSPQVAEALISTEDGSCQEALVAVKKALECPLSRKMFVNPTYCIKDGFTYERREIEHLISIGSNSPISGSYVKKDDLTKNHLIQFILKIIHKIEHEGQSNQIEEDEMTDQTHENCSNDSFLCPITLAQMRSPRSTPSGHSYERSAIEKHLATTGTSPLTRKKTSVAELRKNYALKNAIQSESVRIADMQRTMEKKLMVVEKLEKWMHEVEYVQKDKQQLQTPPRKRRRLTKAESI